MGAPDQGTRIIYRIATWLVAFICTWVILDYGQPLLMPFIFAVFSAILISPILEYLVARKIPRGPAILLAQGVGFLPIIAFVLVFLLTVGPVQERLPWYQQQLRSQFARGIDFTLDWMERHDLMPEQDGPAILAPLPANEPALPLESEDGAAPEPAANGGRDAEPAHPESVAPGGRTVSQPPGETPKERLRRQWKGKIIPTLVTEGATWAQSIVGTTTVVLLNLLLVVVFTAFILIEGSRFAEKMDEAFGKNNPIMLSLMNIASDVRTYLVAKTLISAMTGLLVWIFLTVTEVDFAGFWGLAAFALNYIPNIGSVLASVPPMLISLLNALLVPEVSLWNPVIVATGLTILQLGIGTVVDPRLIGSSLQLSPFVILLSMLTWGLLWGPIGMILSVPIMVCLKIICSHVEGLEPIATLMKA